MENQIKKIIERILEKNNWGLYFKGSPLVMLPVNGEASVYRLNDISVSELEGAISEQVKLIIEEIKRQGDTECQTKEGLEEM